MTTHERLTVAEARRRGLLPSAPAEPAGPTEDAHRRLQHPEDELQAAIVQWLGYSLRPDVRFTHAPNERRDVLEAKRMKRAGVLPGWPDLTFAWSDYTPHSLSPRVFTSRVAFLEVKAPRGSLSREQRAFRDWCVASGIPHAVVRSLDEAIAAVSRWRLTRNNPAAEAPEETR